MAAENKLALEKVTEMTINTRKLIIGCKKNKKASSAIRKLKKFIQKQWRSDNPVYLHSDVSKKIFARGNFASVGRVRIRVVKARCKINPENSCFNVTLVDVSSFKKLQDCTVTDEE